MRSRVAGVFPLKVQPATWVAAIAVAALWVAASLYVADHIIASNAPSVQPRATIATEPTQIPNRAAKAAREAFKKEARLDEDVAGPNPEIVTPLPEDDGDDEGQTETGRSTKILLEAFKQEARLDEDIAGPNPEIVTPLPEDDGDDEGQTETGRASWYQLDSKTASGEPMDATALTAAHPTLPLGTQVRVVNLDNDRAVVVRINDRGPFAKGRVIDLSRAAAVALDMIEAGVAEVRVTPIAGVIASN
jgi:rare lipoprotein A (peptidoglycan hydrolase)